MNMREIEFRMAVWTASSEGSTSILPAVMRGAIQPQLSAQTEFLWGRAKLWRAYIIESSGEKSCALNSYFCRSFDRRLVAECSDPR